MSEENNKNQNEKRPRRFSQQQYDLLKKCSDENNLAEWNRYRMNYPEEDIELEEQDFAGWFLEEAYLQTGPFGYPGDFKGKVHLRKSTFRKAKLRKAEFNFAHLEGADLIEIYGEETHFDYAHLDGAYFFGAHLENADFNLAELQGAEFADAHLEGASFNGSNLKGAIFMSSHIQRTQFRVVILDGETKFWHCKVSAPVLNIRGTDFTGSQLDTVRIDPETKQLLEYNMRRMNWEEWYKQHKILKWPVWLFWWMSDYGLSTGRIIIAFFVLAIAFACIYYIWGMTAPPGIIDNLIVDGNGVEVAWWLVPIRAIHFSIVIMTVGFTNMHANAHSFWAHILVGLQMILGFVLLGALVTRFAILFTAGGPAGKFADENKKDADDKVS